MTHAAALSSFCWDMRDLKKTSYMHRDVEGPGAVPTKKILIEFQFHLKYICSNFDRISVSFEMHLFINSSISLGSHWYFAYILRHYMLLRVCPTFCCDQISHIRTIMMKILIELVAGRAGSFAIEQLGYFLLNCISFYNIVHSKCNILVWNCSNTITILLTLWILMTWCITNI